MSLTYQGNMRRAILNRISSASIYLIISILTVSCLMPIIYAVSISITEYETFYQDGPKLLPRRISFHTYRLILVGATKFLRGLKNSLVLTIFGVSASVFLTTMTGFAMSRRRLPGRRAMLRFFYVSSFFSGGLVPLYLLLRMLGLLNSYAAIILPNVIVMGQALLAKNYFIATFPDDLEESARLDGAGELTVLVKIVIPNSMAIIAVLVLFNAVIYWNTFAPALFFLQERRKMPLMVILQQILWAPFDIAANFGGQEVMSDSRSFPQGLAMTGIVISVVPIVVVYPFMQRHFVKGIYIGALKE